MIRKRKHRTSTGGRSFRRSSAIGLAAAFVGAGLFPSPSHALVGPNASDDFHEQIGRGSAHVNVLANDSWDPEQTARVVSAQVVGQPFASFSYATRGDSESIPSPAVTVHADNTLTVDFGPYALATLSLYRVAEISYLMRDSAGQQATGYVKVVERRADSPLSAADDTYPTAGNPVPLLPSEEGTDLHDLLGNDSFGALGSVRVEILSAPTLGTLDITRQPGFVPDGNPSVSNGPVATYTPQVSESEWVSTWQPDPYSSIEPTVVRTDAFSYRICSTATDDCSSPATSSLTYRATRHTGVPSAPLSRTYWTGGPAFETFDLRERAIASPAASPDYVAAVAAGTPVLVDVRGNADFGTLSKDSNGTWTHVRAPGQTEGETFTIEWRDADGRVLAVTRVDYEHRSPDALTLTDDEAWVAMGQSTLIRPLLNDPLPFDQNLGNGTQWVGTDGTAWARRVDSATLGDVAWHHGVGQPSHVSANESIRYAAGNLVGTEVVPYTICSPYPTDAGCTTADIKVHVSPLAEAKPDTETTRPGVPVNIRLMGNDTFTDTSTQNATVTLLNVPDGVTAVVNPDRTVTVTAPEAMRGTIIEFSYRLTDFTGSTTATVRVEITDDAVPPVPVAPDALDDVVGVMAGSSATAQVLSNDVHGANPVITLVGETTDGMTAEVVDGVIQVFVPEDFALDSGTVPYLLTDDSGLTDTATLMVTVNRPPPEAVNDKAQAKPGDTVLVDVLANDEHLDVPTKATVTTGKGATVTEERWVSIYVPSDYKRKALSKEYTLCAKGGCATATIAVKVLHPVAPTAPPIARDDKAQATYSVPVRVDTLANDQYAGQARVQVVKGSVPTGVTVNVDAKNRVVVTAAKSRAGDTVLFQYRLGDKTKKSDVATVRVKVAEDLIIVTGADREAPASHEVDPNALSNGETVTEGNSTPVLVGAGLLALLGLSLAARRFRRTVG
jgi:hypothetical protein